MTSSKLEEMDQKIGIIGANNEVADHAGTVGSVTPISRIIVQP